MIDPIVSNREHFYETHNLFNRNKRYYDAENIMKMENDFETKRRTPQAKSFEKEKFQSSFLNSTALLSSRLSNQIDRFKSRLSFSRNVLSEDNHESQEVSKSPKKIKGVPMNLLLPRKGIIEESKDPADERLFNNYKLQKPELNHTPDLEKMTGRNLDVTLPHINDIIIDSNKAYQKMYFKKTPFHCKFEFKLQKDEKGRVWYNKKRPEDISSTNIDAEKIQRGVKYSSNFHRNQISHFYNSSGKQLPPQLLMKTMKSNENYWKSPQTSKYIRPNLDFSLKRMKDNIIEGKKEQEIKAKAPQLTKQLVCNEYFYRRNRSIKE